MHVPRSPFFESAPFFEVLWGYHKALDHLVWVTKVALAAICLVFPALVLGYYFSIVESMTYQFLYRLKNLYDYCWQR